MYGRLAWVHGAAPAVRRDHFDAVTLSEIPIQPVPIVRLVADQSFGEEVEEAVREDPSTSWLSCGATLSTLTARGRLLSSVTQRRFSCLFRVVSAPSRAILFRSREGGIDECLL